MTSPTNVEAPSERVLMINMIRVRLVQLRRSRENYNVTFGYGAALALISAAHQLGLITGDETDRLLGLASSATVEARRNTIDE